MFQRNNKNKNNGYAIKSPVKLIAGLLFLLAGLQAQAADVRPLTHVYTAHAFVIKGPSCQHLGDQGHASYPTREEALEYLKMVKGIAERVNCTMLGGIKEDDFNLTESDLAYLNPTP